MALQDLLDHQVPQALLALLEKRGRWARASKDQKVTKASKGSAAPQESLDRRKSRKKETSPQQEKRVRKVKLDFRECQGLERKVNLESQGLGENLAKTVKKEKGEVRVSLAIRGTQDSPAGRALREKKVKLDFRALLELDMKLEAWEKKEIEATQDHLG